MAKTKQELSELAEAIRVQIGTSNEFLTNLETLVKAQVDDPPTFPSKLSLISSTKADHHQQSGLTRAVCAVQKLVLDDSPH